VKTPRRPHSRHAQYWRLVRAPPSLRQAAGPSTRARPDTVTVTVTFFFRVPPIRHAPLIEAAAVTAGLRMRRGTCRSRAGGGKPRMHKLLVAPARVGAAAAAINQPSLHPPPPPPPLLLLPRKTAYGLATPVLLPPCLPNHSRRSTGRRMSLATTWSRSSTRHRDG
jgi:hypothetical protein